MAYALTGKMHIKPSMKGIVLHRPEGVVLPLPAAEYCTDIDKAGKDLDFAIVFAERLQIAADAAPAVLAALRYDGLLWVCYPKQTSRLRSDLNRDILWDEYRTFNLEGVAIISIDNTWSALRFRPAAEVRSRKRTR